ncbi:hypothetical protein Bca101_057960 [Brassica carinata]
MELIDRSQFSRPDRFKLHNFISALLCRGRHPWPARTTPWNCFVFLVHLRLRLKTKPPQTSLPQASSSLLQIVASVSGHRTISVVFLCRCCHARIQASLSCSSLPSLSRYRRDRVTMAISYFFATQALQPLDILKLAPIVPSVEIASRIGH